MKIKTSELIGPALDLAVAIAYGLEIQDGVPIWFNDDGELSPFNPSSDRSLGGLIIQQMKIATAPSASQDDWWVAGTIRNDQPFKQEGDSPLVAAMRCYVASVLGNEVDIPNTLFPRKAKALEMLATALRVATDCDVLDGLLAYCRSPDSINDVCDAVIEARASS